jgi:hypothetical protein
VNALPRSLPSVALAVAAVILVVQIPVIAGGQTWDDVRYHADVAPPRMAASEAIGRGELPQWWDGSGLGVPLAGEPSHGAMYPPLWLAGTPRALDLANLAHLAWAALGVAVWARRRASDRGAMVAGVLAATTGLLMSAALRGALPGLAHLPWLGAAAVWLAEAATRRSRAGAACAIGALIAAIVLAGELAILLDGLALGLTLGLRRGTARWLAAALAAGLAIGAAQWLPAVLQLPAGVGAEVAGLPLARLIELVVPGAFGGAIPSLAGPAPWAPSLFLGAPVLALAAVRSVPRRTLSVIAGLAIAALVAGRGGWPAWLGAPELHLAALGLVLAVAAADGVDALVLGQRRAVLALVVGAGATGLVLIALAVLRAQHGELGPPIDRSLVDGAIGVVCMVGAAVLAWRAPGHKVAVLFALLVAPGGGAARSIAPTIDRALVSEPPPWVVLAGRAAPPRRAFRPVFVQDRRDRQGRAALEDAIATFAGGSAWRWGIAAARSEDPARSAAHDRTWLAAAREGGALLDRYGVALAILPSTLVGPRKLSALGRRGDWALVELPVAPAASVMTGWRWAIEPEDALALLFPGAGGTGLLRGTIVLAGAGEPGPAGHEPRPCTIRGWHSGDIELGCVADAASYAVVSSAAAAGWAVTIDDHPADWLTADVLRRAVAVPAGEHVVRWTYVAPGLFSGLGVALAGLAGLVALALIGCQRRRSIAR